MVRLISPNRGMTVGNLYEPLVTINGAADVHHADGYWQCECYVVLDDAGSVRVVGQDSCIPGDEDWSPPPPKKVYAPITLTPVVKEQEQNENPS